MLLYLFAFMKQSRLKEHINKNDLSSIFHLYSHQSWIMDREDKFIDLFLLCETTQHKSLILNLLTQFHFLESKTFNDFLNRIADFIVTETGFKEETTQIAAITFDDEADSSQKILDYIKMPLFEIGWSNIQTVNKFSSIVKNHKRGKTQILCIDEFVGSGKTVLKRIQTLKNYISSEFELKFCFIAGMDHGLKEIENQGYEVYCPLRLKKGISESFDIEELEKNINLMLYLEQKLASKVNKFELSDYSLGYGKAEALYSSADQRGNTPNSVFPIFWWPRSREGKQRNTLLNRFERGLK